MSTNDSSTQARGVEQIRASLERITRDFDNMIGRMRMDNARIRMLSDRLPPLANRGQSKPGSAALPAGWQSFIESQARQKAAGKELVAAASAFAQELIQWAERMKQRQQEQAGEAAAKQPVANGLVTAAERAAEAQKFAQLAEQYSQEARDEDQLAGPAAFLPDGVFPPDENERHKLAAKEAKDLAEEFQLRAYILEHGKEGDYRNLVIYGDSQVKGYGINNPNLNDIVAYYATKFNDQNTLNWLKLQHPAVPPSTDQIINDVGMMALLPHFDGMSEAEGESPLAGKAPEKSIFEQATDIEGKIGYKDRESGAVDTKRIENTTGATRPTNTSSYIASLQTRPPVGSGAAKAFQIANAGPVEYSISGGGERLWADGLENATILEAKFVGNAKSSPYIPGSSIDDSVREMILARVENEFFRMQKIINDPSNPLSSVRVITNDPAANQYFRSLLDKYGLKGEIKNP